jgi:4-carboxymuconolactone decarboxylase
MKMIPSAIGLILVAGSSMAAGHALGARSGQTSPVAAASSAQASAAIFPKDVYADTGNRLPALKRDDLNDAGKKLFDSRPPADRFGPGPIRLYNPSVGEYMGAVNDYLRSKSGLDPRLVQLVILVSAREADSEYVWTAHEPQGLKAGLQPEIIDIIRYRKPTTGLAEKDAALIDLGREVFEKHHLSSAVYARAQTLFGKEGLVSYVSLMGDYAATTILLNAFDQHIRPADKAKLPIP